MGQKKEIAKRERTTGKKRRRGIRRRLKGGRR